MNDIVERLRTGFDWDESASNVWSLIQYGDLTDEAADEIEFLRKQLTECQAREKVLRDLLDYASYKLREYTEGFTVHWDAVDAALAMPFDSTALDAYLKENGWRQCAKGQHTTEWCAATEEAIKQAKREALHEASCEYLGQDDDILMREHVSEWLCRMAEKL